MFIVLLIVLSIFIYLVIKGKKKEKIEAKKVSYTYKENIYVNANLPDTLISINNFEFNIHPDIKDLIWIADGPNKNYFPENDISTIKINDDISINVSFSFKKEPSAIYFNSAIKKVDDIKTVDPPGYFPSFLGLNPSQRYIYANYLNNPYRTDLNIGYTFILYYGLERFLLTDKYEDAFNVILNLRKIHNNNSFRSYSLDGLFFCCLVNKRIDLFNKLKLYLEESNDISKIYIFSKYIFKENLSASDLIKLSKHVGFSNQRYIANNYDLFLDTLNELLLNSFGKKEFNISYYDIQNSKDNFRILLANYSLDSDLRSTEFPDILSNKQLKQDIINLLQYTHNYVKAKLEAERRLGNELSNNKQAIMLSIFTIEELKEFLENKNLKLSGNKKDLIVRILDNFCDEEINSLFKLK